MESMSTPKYHYGKDFQLKILAVLAKYPNALLSNRDAVKPTYFDSADSMTFCSILLSYVDAYNRLPDQTACTAAAEDAITKYHVNETLSKNIRQLIPYVYQLEVEDSDYIIENIVNFARRQELKLAVSRTIELLEKPDADLFESKKLVDRALMIGQNKTPCMDFGNVGTNLPSMLTTSLTYSKRIPTLLPTIDKCMMGGLLS